MGRLHVYLKPYANDSGTAYETDWREVSADVVELGALQQQLDNTEQDVGVFRIGNMKLRLRNDHGRYGNVGSVETIFKYKRGDSLVRITWEPGEGPLVCGFFELGWPHPMLSEEEEVFEGLLNDTATVDDVDDQTVEFQVLGYESLLQGMDVPFSGISNGDSFEDALLAILDQAPLNELVTVDVANIATGVAELVDAKDEMENKTAYDVVKILLQGSNSVLYIRDGVLYTGPREEGADLAYTFYGQGAIAGIENILPLDVLRSGQNRVLNFLTWKDEPTVLVQDATSRALYGNRKKEFDIPYITNPGRREDLLESYRDEFRNAKRELSLSAALTPELLGLYLLDKVKVDYPAPFVPGEDDQTAFYGSGRYGTDYYANSLFALSIEDSARFKILSRKIDFKAQTATFGLREV